MSSIACSNLSFAWPDDTPLFTDLSFTVGEGRTGLVAPNGAGKSTLLRLIAREYLPTAGTITVDGTVGYLPQTLPFVAERTVADVLGVGQVLGALDALAAGDAGDDVFTAIGDDWHIEERTRAQLDRLGLDEAFLFPNYGLVWEHNLVNDLEATKTNMGAWNRWAVEVAADGRGRLHPVAHLTEAGGDVAGHRGDRLEGLVDARRLQRGAVVRLLVVGAEVLGRGRGLCHVGSPSR